MLVLLKVRPANSPARERASGMMIRARLVGGGRVVASMLGLAAALSGLAVIGPAGCTGSSIGARMGMSVGSIRVNNKTDRLVRVELVNLGRDNSIKTYSTQILAMDASFEHGAGKEQRLPGMRARFSLQDAGTGDDNINVVQLGVPEDGVREYDLRLINGRLTAREIGIEAGRRR